MPALYESGQRVRTDLDDCTTAVGNNARVMSAQLNEAGSRGIEIGFKKLCGLPGWMNRLPTSPIHLTSVRN